MTRNELFSLAEQSGHQILFTDLHHNEALSVELDGKCYIALDCLATEVDEKELLAHELGHCEYAGFYSILTPLNTRERIEYKAKKWQIRKLVPLDKLQAALYHGITAPWELAEYFDVSETLIMDACQYYTNAYGSIIKEVER